MPVYNVVSDQMEMDENSAREVFMLHVKVAGALVVLGVSYVIHNFFSERQ